MHCVHSMYDCTCIVFTACIIVGCTIVHMPVVQHLLPQQGGSSLSSAYAALLWQLSCSCVSADELGVSQLMHKCVGIGSSTQPILSMIVSY